jgi:hypothetical protein
MQQSSVSWQGSWLIERGRGKYALLKPSLLLFVTICWAVISRGLGDSAKTLGWTFILLFSTKGAQK